MRPGTQRRHRKPEEVQGRERWLVSYADLITLLFAFFVVMYSISSVNEGKYEALSETLEGVFGASRQVLQPIPVDDQGSQQATTGERLAPEVVAPAEPAATRIRQADILDRIAQALTVEFGPMMGAGLVTVNRADEWVELSLRDSLLFGSGEAEPHYDALPVVEAIAAILRQHDNAVLVEGFTDNQPIRTRQYASNWELSAARAAAIVRLLAVEGLDPRNLAAVGYGEFQPVARNDTAEGRKRNRRVILLIARGNLVRGLVR